MESDPQRVTGRTKPARAPVAPGPASEALAAAMSGLSAGPVATPPAADATITPRAPVSDAPPSFSPLAAPGVAAFYPTPLAAPGMAPVHGPLAPTRLPAQQSESNPLADEERVLIMVLRFLDRIEGPRTLSTVERAFIAGAKIILEKLAEECDSLINLRSSDLCGLPPTFSGPPILPFEDDEPAGDTSSVATGGAGSTSTGGAGDTVAAGAGAAMTGGGDTGAAGAGPASTAQPDDAAGASPDRLARLESRVDRLADLIERQSRARS